MKNSRSSHCFNAFDVVYLDDGLINIAASITAEKREGDFLMKGGKPRVSKDGNWSESYAGNLIDWHLKEQLTN